VLTVLKSLFKSAVNLIDSLFLTPLLQLVEALGHLLPDLLGGFQVGHEFLLIHLVLSLQKSPQSIKLIKWQLIPVATLI
jgi:hypothetical protein